MSAEPTVVTEEPAAEPSVIATPAAEPVSDANWRDSLSVDHRDNPSLADFKDVDALAKSYIHQGKLIGADKIAIPGEDATPEDWSAFHGKLGRPDKAEDYDLTAVEVPEGLPWDGEFQTSMVSKMHELGLNQKQVAGVLGAYIESTTGQYEQATGDMERTRDAGIKDLQTSWGKSYPAQVDLARRAIMAGAGEGYNELAGLLMQDGGMLGDHPAVVRAFATLGGKMSEHGLVGATAARTTQSPAEAGGEVNKLMGDETFMAAYMQSEHPEHAAAVQRIADLTEAQVGTE